MFDLSKISLFSGLPNADLAAILPLMKPITLAADTLVIIEGEISNNLYIVESGELEVFISNESGSKFVLANLGSNSYFGELAFLDNAERAASVKTTSECKLFEIKKDDFTQILQTYPIIYTFMVKNLVAIIRQLNDKVKQLALKDVYPALRQYLIEHSCQSFGNRKKSDQLNPKVIAKQVNSQTDTIAYLLAYLEDNRYIDIDGDNIYIYKTLPEKITH